MRSRALAKQLTPRDTELILWIGRAGVASLDQVARRFWAGRSLQTAEGRLRRLVRAGYLERHSCNIRRVGEPVFCLTEQGYREFGTAYRERLQVGLPTHLEMKQQLMAQDAYLLLDAQIQREGSRLVEWRSERELRAEFRRRNAATRRKGELWSPLDIPDAQATVITGQGQEELLYIEIDGAYYGKMLCEKAKCLAGSGHRVVWVCTQERAPYVEKALACYPNIQVLLI